MSYHLGPSQAPAPLAPAIQPHQYPLLPLSQVPPSGIVLDANTKRVLIIIAILLVAVIIFSMIGKKSVTRNHRPVKRISTPELAKNMFERLERRGGANPTTMRSLQSYASKR